MLRSLSFLSFTAPLTFPFLGSVHLKSKQLPELFTLMLQEVQGYAIFTTNAEGIIASWNPGARYLLGYKENEIIGKSIIYLYPSEKENEHIKQDMALAQEKGQYEHITEVLKKNKKKIFVKCVMTALWGRDNQLKGFSGILQDITAQIMKSKKQEEFMRMAGHELKNPITSIKAYLQLLELKLTRKGDTTLLHGISQAVSQVDKLTILITHFLNTSRFAIGKLPYNDNNTIELATFLLKVIEPLQVSYPTHKILLKQSTAITLTKIDQERLEQVIVNLLLNAIKYSPENKPIVVSVRKDNNYAHISIIDKGIGIAKKDVKNIFQKFYRGDYAKKIQDGLGLGLSLAHEIISHYKGKIEVESVKKKGTTFSVNLPIL